VWFKRDERPVVTSEEAHRFSARDTLVNES
jgi:hypothetical protein